MRANLDAITLAGANTNTSVYLGRIQLDASAFSLSHSLPLGCLLKPPVMVSWIHHYSYCYYVHC